MEKIAVIQLIVSILYASADLTLKLRDKKPLPSEDEEQESKESKESEDENLSTK